MVLNYMTPYNFARFGAPAAYGAMMSLPERIGQRNRIPGGGTRTMTRRKKRKGFGGGKSFAQRVRNLAPYKHNAISDSAINPTLTHNSIYTTTLTSKIAQGDDNASRDGDRINLVALRVSGCVHSSAAVTGANTYRLLVLWSGEEYNVTASTSGLTLAEIFLPTGGGLVSRAIVNPKAVTVLHDVMVDIDSLITTTANVSSFDFKVPINQIFSYQGTGSVFGKMKNLYLVVIGSIIGGSGSVGTALINTDLIFQNA